MTVASPLGDILWSLLNQSPVLLACIAAVVLGLSSLSRMRLPATLAIFGGGLYLLTSIAWNIGVVYLIESSQYVHASFPLLIVAESVCRAIALGCLVAAIFVGRDSPESNSGYPLQKPMT